MTDYNIEFTWQELRVLSIELGYLFEEYTKRADSAHKTTSSTEDYWQRLANDIKPILDKVNAKLK